MKKIISNAVRAFMSAFILIIPLAANTTRDIGSMPELNTAAVNRWILFYTNIERVKNNMVPLEYDPVLEKAANWQAEYCARDLRSLSHYSSKPGMGNPGERIRFFGGTWSTYGENVTVVFATNTEGVSFYPKSDEKGAYKDYGDYVIYWRSDKQTAYAMVDSWMHSSGHRANILNRDFSSMAGGSSAGKYSGLESYYGAQVFTGNSKIDFKKLKAEKKENGYHITYSGTIAVKCFALVNKTDLQEIKTVKLDDVYICEFPADFKGEVFAGLADGEITYPVLKLK